MGSAPDADGDGFKFFVSSAIYSATVAWYLHHVSQARRTAWLVGTGLGTALLIELALITLQAWRGVPSHFNIGSRLDATVFGIMGATIGVLSVLHGALWLLLLASRHEPRAARAACRWGAGLTLVGLAVGALMVRPLPSLAPCWPRSASLAWRISGW
ncbi:MAG: hypothetical protein ACR2LU_13485 [Luteitalea sp.]